MVCMWEDIENMKTNQQVITLWRNELNNFPSHSDMMVMLMVFKLCFVRRIKFLCLFLLYAQIPFVNALMEQDKLVHLVDKMLPHGIKDHQSINQKTIIITLIKSTPSYYK